MNKIVILIEQTLIFTVLIMQITTAVNTFPQILTGTYNQTANLSSSTILTCHIQDLGDHHVTWFKFDSSTPFPSPLAVGKQSFTTDQRYSISFYSTSPRDSFWSLEIYQLELSDEGTYICKIANRRASVSMSIHLHIQIPMVIYPTYVYAEPGVNIQLNCSILINENHGKKPSITWHFLSNDMNRSKPQDVYIRKRSSNDTFSSYLIINHTQLSHTGLWTCVYRRQRLSAKVIVQKDVLKHQRASALLSSHSNELTSSICVLLLILFCIVVCNN